MAIKGYLFTLIGIAVISILIEVILPSGKMQKFVKAIFNIIVLVIILFPVITFISKDYKIDYLSFNTEIEVDSDYLEATNKKLYSQIEKNIETELVNIGYSNVNISIDFELENLDTIIKQITVDISSIKININMPHKEIKSDIIQVINKYININKINLVFIE